MLKYLLSFIILLSAGWGSYAVIHNNIYPVAVVNFKMISKKNFETASLSALNYYKKMKKPNVSDADFEKEIRRATLDKLIENILISEEVNGAEVDNQLASLIVQNKDLENGIAVAYGISWDNFKNFILRPQVAEEILQKKLKELKKDFPLWLKNKKTDARVFLLVSNFKWSGERVELK